MCDRHLFELSPGWILGYDEKQWTVLKGRSKNGITFWRAVSFVASNKLVLAQVLDHLGVVVTDKGQQALDQLPDRFADFLTLVLEAEK